MILSISNKCRNLANFTDTPLCMNIIFTIDENSFLSSRQSDYLLFPSAMWYLEVFHVINTLIEF